MSFIFQSARAFRTEIRAGYRVAWLASRYRDQMRKGDIVYFWLAGEPRIRGLYGWGVITAEAPRLWPDGVYRIEVEYRRNFLNHEKHKHVSSEDIKKDPVLRNHLIFRMAVGTNFLLTDEEDQALRDIIAQEYGQDWLPPQPRRR